MTKRKAAANQPVATKQNNGKTVRDTATKLELLHLQREDNDDRVIARRVDPIHRASAIRVSMETRYDCVVRVERRETARNREPGGENDSSLKDTITLPRLLSVDLFWAIRFFFPELVAFTESGL